MAATLLRQERQAAGSSAVAGYLRVERYVGGALFIGLGLTAAFAGNQKK